MKKFVALLLAMMMVLSMVTIGASAEEVRTIYIGTTWDIYWDSLHPEASDIPNWTGTLADEMMLANVKRVEEKYNVRLENINLTYAGAKESINTSVLAGTPDVDVYMLDLNIAAPAVANGYVMDMRDVLPSDNAVVQGKDAVLSYIDTGNGAVALLTNNNAENMVGSTMPLAFNLQMIEDANLEDPRDLVERGEWTWEKFREYCKALTKDTDGDGTTDVYGFGGWPGDYFPQFVMSNGTNVAATDTENLSSAEVGEVLQFIQDLNLVDQVMHPIPEENGWDVCRWLYREGKVAFTPIAAWIMDNNKDYAFNDPDAVPLEFDMVFVPWPVGPSGDAETNAQKVTASSCYVIPVGVEDPELVFNVLYDFLNWYGYDPNSEDGGEAALAIRDDPEALSWWYGVTARDIDLQDYNFEIMMEMGRHQLVDNVNSLGIDLPLREFINGDYTTAQLQETYRQTYQEKIDALLGK